MIVRNESKNKQNKALAECECIYLDHAATTPVDPRALEMVYSVMSNNMIGNAHAKHHIYGNTALQIVQAARDQVAACIGAQPENIIFTSGATESNNLVIKGLAGYLKSTGKTHIVTTVVEHKSVLEPLDYLKTEGFEITKLLVKPCGMITEGMIERALKDKTGLICVQAVNNETGTIQPLNRIAAMLAGRNILFHSDATQALGKIPFSVEEAGVDFASFSAHKIYGPQGIGALYLKSNRMELLTPLHSGGGQESGLRSGTLPAALCAGFGAACSLIQDDRQYVQKLRFAFLDRIEELKPIIHGHRDPAWNVAGILNIRFSGIDSEALVMALPALAFGTGAACKSTGGSKFSHVIKAITGSDQAAKEAIRLSFGCSIAKETMDKVADQFISAVKDIRQLQGVA